MEPQGLSLIKLRNEGRTWKVVSPAPAPKKAGESIKEAKTWGVFYQLNKRRRMNRLEMIEQQMEYLQQQMDKVREDGVRDDKLYKEIKRQRRQNVIVSTSTSWKLEGSFKKSEVPSPSSTTSSVERMSPELVEQLIKMIDRLNASDLVEISEAVCYYDIINRYKPQDEDDILSIRCLKSPSSQWKVLEMVQAKLSNAKKISSVVGNEKEVGSFVPSAVQKVDEDPMKLCAIPESQLEPTPGCSIWTEEDVASTGDKGDNENWEDDDDEDDDTLLDIY